MESRSGDVHFRILGPVEAIVDGAAVTFARPQHRDLLGLLLLRHNQLISAEEIIDGMWGPTPPPTATSQVQNMVSAVRVALRGSRVKPAIVRRRGGYQLEVVEGCIDLTVFEQMMAVARTSAPRETIGVLRDALALWRGSPLADVHAPYAVAAAAGLRERQLLALEMLFEAELTLGNHSSVLPELVAAAAEHPLRERLTGQLMTALYRCGRQAEALESYQNIRRLLAAEHGLDPGPALRELERMMLTADPALDPPVPQGEPVRPSAPAAPAHFVGRQAQLTHAREVLGKAGGCLALYGPPGVGKTALALAAAESLQAHFPDGQLFLDLGGGAGQSDHDLVGMVLRALGVAGTALRTSDAERMAQLCQVVAARRLLLILDNVTDEKQVRGTLRARWHSVLLTSRGRLAALENVQHLRLGMFDHRMSMELLAGLAPDQAKIDPTGTREIAHLCGGLPLAVRLAGAKLAARPHWTPAMLAGRLADERHRLDELRVGDLAVRSSIELSYATQNTVGQRTLRVLGMLAGHDIEPWLAAAALSVPEHEAFDLLEELVDAQLIDASGQPLTRYRMHDLIRVFAREQFHAVEPRDASIAVARRVAEAYLGVATRAERKLGLEGVHPCGRFDTGEVLAGNPPDSSVAVQPHMWLTERRVGVLSAITQAHAAELWDHTWSLTRAMAPVWEAGGFFDEWLETSTLALDAAARANQPTWTAAIGAGLGTLHHYRSDWTRSREHLERAIAIWSAVGDQRRSAYARLMLAMTIRAMGSGETAAILYSALEVGLAERDPVLEVESLRCLAWLDRDGGEPEQACARLRRASEHLSKMDSGSSRLRGYVLHDLAVMVNDLGDHEQAAAILGVALDIFTELGDQHWTALARVRLGETYDADGRSDTAIDHLRTALQLFQVMHDQSWEALVLFRLGCIHTTLGQYENAHDFLEHACAIYRRSGRTWDLACVQVGVGELREAQGDHRAALAAFEKADKELGNGRANRWALRARAGVNRLRHITPVQAG